MSVDLLYGRELDVLETLVIFTGLRNSTVSKTHNITYLPECNDSDFSAYYGYYMLNNDSW